MRSSTPRTGCRMPAGNRPRRTRLACALIAGACAAAATAFAGQGPPDGIDPAAVPVDQEQHHRAVFTNEYVRIIDAFFPPLSTSQYHAHLFDNVAVTILPGTTDAQGQARIGFAAFSRGGYSHTVTNPNTAPMRFIDVELLTPPPTQEAGDVPDKHELVVSHTRVRVYRLKVEAGQKIPVHQHGAGYVSIVVRGGEAGAWRWHGADEAPGPLAAGKQPLEIVEIEPR